MSLQLVDAAFDAVALRGSLRNVLLVLAHHAHRDTCEAFPRVALIARRAQLSERQVQYHLRALERDGVLEVLDPGQGRGRCRRWRVVPEAVAAAGDVEAWRAWREKVQPPLARKGATHGVKGAVHAGARSEPLNPPPLPPAERGESLSRISPPGPAHQPLSTDPPFPGMARGDDVADPIDGKQGRRRRTAAERRAEREAAEAAARAAVQRAASEAIDTAMAERSARAKAEQEAAASAEARRAAEEVRRRFVRSRSG